MATMADRAVTECPVCLAMVRCVRRAAHLRHHGGWVALADWARQAPDVSPFPRMRLWRLR
jgi:hypothetical protein